MDVNLFCLQKIMDPDDVRALTDYLTKGVYPLGLNRDDKRSLRQKATSFLIHEGRLYHRGKEGRKQLVICSADEKQQIINMMHTDPGSRGGHNGMNMTIRKIGEQFWWRRLVEDVRTFCKNCAVCGQATSAKQRSALPTEWPEDLISVHEPVLASAPMVDMQYAPYAGDLLRMLRALFQQKICCDVVVSAGRFQLHAHKVVLIASSGYFKSMLLDKDLPFNDVITLSNVPGPCLELLVSYLYSGFLRLNRENVQQMLEAAVSLDISSAVELCQKFLHQECEDSQHPVAAVAGLVATSEMKRTDEKTGLIENCEDLAELELFIETEKLMPIKEEKEESSSSAVSERRIRVKNEDVDLNGHDLLRNLESELNTSCILPYSGRHRQKDPSVAMETDERPQKRSRGRPRKLSDVVRQKSERHYATRSSTGAVVAKRESDGYVKTFASSRLSNSSRSKTAPEVPENSRCANNSAEFSVVVETRNAKTERFRCSVCSVRFLLHASLKLHYTQVHCFITSQEAIYWLSRHSVAKAIGYQFSRVSTARAADNRVDSPDASKYRCQICRSRFRLKSEASLHVSRNHSTSYTCRVARCLRNFNCHVRLLRHQRLLHHHLSSGSMEQIGAAKPADASTPGGFSSGSLATESAFCISNKCGWCGQVFPSRMQLREHRQTVHRRPKLPELVGKKRRVQRDWNCREKGCGQLFKTKDKLKAHMSEAHPSVTFSCPDCRFKTQVEQILLRHLIRRHRERHMCQLCGKAYHKPFLLRVHLFNRHKLSDPQLKLYRCQHEGCDYACPSKNGLNLHILKHTSGNPFVCSQCSKTFKRAVGLEKHVSKIHLGIRPYICDKCGVSYGDESELKNHMSRHAENKPYSCTHCDYSTFQKGSLKSHLFCRHQVLMDHEMSVLKCDQCNFTTDKKCRFHDHVKMHHNIRDIPCAVCGKMFVTKKTLRQHVIKVHHQKQVACAYCPYAASTRSKLNEHLRQHHSCQETSVVLIEPYQHPLPPLQAEPQQVQLQSPSSSCVNGLVSVSEYQTLMPLENAPQFTLPTDASFMVGIPMSLDANTYCFQTIDRDHAVL